MPSPPLAHNGQCCTPLESGNLLLHLNLDIHGLTTAIFFYLIHSIALMSSLNINFFKLFFFFFENLNTNIDYKSFILLVSFITFYGNRKQVIKNNNKLK